MMAQKYIPQDVAQKVANETVRVQKWIKRPVKEGEILKLLILKGLQQMTAEEWRKALG